MSKNIDKKRLLDEKKYKSPTYKIITQEVKSNGKNLNKNGIEYYGKFYEIKHAWYSHMAYEFNKKYYRYLNIYDVPISCTLVTTNKETPIGFNDYKYKGIVFKYLDTINY